MGNRRKKTAARFVFDFVCYFFPQWQTKVTIKSLRAVWVKTVLSLLAPCSSQLIRPAGPAGAKPGCLHEALSTLSTQSLFMPQLLNNPTSLGCLSL